MYQKYGIDKQKIGTEYTMQEVLERLTEAYLTQYGVMGAGDLLDEESGTGLVQTNAGRGESSGPGQSIDRNGIRERLLGSSEPEHDPDVSDRQKKIDRAIITKFGRSQNHQEL